MAASFSPPSTATHRRALLYLLTVFAVAALFRYPIAPIPLERDEGEYAYIGQRWLRGDVPYQASFDQKPPGAFAAFAAIERLFGTGPAAIHWGAQIYTLATLAVIFLLGRRLYSAPAGFFAALLAAFLTADESVKGNAANTELFMLLPMTAALAAALRAVDTGRGAWALAAGALATAAVLFKQVAVFNLLFLLALVLWRRPRMPVLAGLFLVGVVAGAVPVVAYFRQTGTWAEFYDCTVQYNLAYSGETPLAEYRQNFWRTFKDILHTAWPVYALALVPVVRLVSRRGFPEAAPARRGTAVTLGWWASGWLGVATGGYFREHYYIQVIPMLALLAGQGAARLVRPPAAWRVNPVPGLVIVLALVYGVSASRDYFFSGTPDEKCRRLYGRNPFPEARLVAAYIEKESGPEDTVFVFGSEPEVYFYSNRRCAGRYIFMYPLMTAYPGTLERQREALAALRRHRPRFIVTIGDVRERYLPYASFLQRPGTPPELTDGVLRLVERSYVEVGRIDHGSRAPLPLRTGADLRRPSETGLLLQVWKSK